MSSRRAVSAGARRALVAGILVALAAVAAVSTRRVEASPQPRPEDDAVMAGRLLDAVRGAPPLYCELAVRLVDGRVWWSSSNARLIDVDSTASALIRWVHAEHTDARAVPRLVAGLRDDDRCVRRVAGSLLGRVRHPGAGAALVESLDHPGDGTRAAAAVGLGIAGEQRAGAPLIRLLRDPSADVRRAAAWALGAIEHRPALVPLIELLERDTDARARQAAAWAIGEVAR